MARETRQQFEDPDHPGDAVGESAGGIAFPTTVEAPGGSR